MSEIIASGGMMPVPEGTTPVNLEMGRPYQDGRPFMAKPTGSSATGLCQQSSHTTLPHLKAALRTAYHWCRDRIAGHP